MAKRVFFSLLKWIVLLAIIVWVGERIQLRDLAWPVETSRESAASGRLEKTGPAEAVFIREDGSRLLLTARMDDGSGGSGALTWIDRETGRAWNLQMGYLYR
ncbi:MAG: hypothetical protein LLG06_17530, partial [Desulfobacteraceae bacterium]|nr:hypothetical protein [Desulfobacteraceae bacterium]